VEARGLQLVAARTIRRHVSEMTDIVMTGVKMKVAGMSTIDANIVMTVAIVGTEETEGGAVMSAVDVKINERE
jgi:hypothetical protein